jgi:hypothetical protein
MMMTELVDPADMKTCTRTTWATGAFAAVTRRQLRSADEDLMQPIGTGTGKRVLDVACDAGIAARRAAQACVGLTLEPSGVARREAAGAGLTVELVHGNGEMAPAGSERTVVREERR